MEIIEKILITEGFIEKTLETISAFENSKGGVIYLFKKDSSESKNAELLSSLNEAKSNIQKQMLNSNVLVPSLLLEGNFSLEKVEGKTELKITVPAAPASMRPVTFNGRVIKYGKNGNYIANASEIEAMKNDADGYAIDHEILPRVMPEDIFGEAYAEFREAFAELHGFWSELNDIDFGLNIHALAKQDGVVGVTRAGLLMFGKEYLIENEIPGYGLSIQIHQKDSNKPSLFVSGDGAFEGGLFSFFRFAKDLVIERRVFGKSASEKALFEEILLNALIHSNFFLKTPLNIEVFDDHYYIANPGLLLTDPYGDGSNRAFPRHPLIQKLFYLIGAGNGRGMSRINGNSRVTIESNEEDNATIVRVGEGAEPIAKKPNIVEPQAAAKPLPAKDSPQLKELADALEGEFKQSVIEGLGQLYVRVQEDVFGRTEVLDAPKVSPATATALIKKLAKKKIIKAVKGKGKGKFRFKPLGN